MENGGRGGTPQRDTEKETGPSNIPASSNVTTSQFPSKSGLAFPSQRGSSRCREVVEPWAEIPGLPPGV